MKTLLTAILLIVSVSANAGMWQLVHSEYVPGTGWICTYSLMGTNYETTIISRNFCQSFINN